MELNIGSEFITYDEDNLTINEIYDEDNYIIKLNNNGEKGICYIFFSSNGLYFPNNKESFQKNIIKDNKYEWINLTSRLNPEKVIYIRDIWLSWYVKGINSRINNIDALIEWLRKETNGYRVKIVGMSSGGYIGALVGSFLQAELCFCFSGQFSLKNHNNHVKENILLKKYYDTRGKWYDIYQYIEESKVNIIYFFPQYVEHDKIQSEFVKLHKNVLSISFKSKIHAKTIFSYDYPKILTMDIEEIKEILNSINKTPISALEFSYRINGSYKTTKLILKKLINKYLK